MSLTKNMVMHPELNKQTMNNFSSGIIINSTADSMKRLFSTKSGIPTGLM